jgi:hypothetical protein
MPLPLATQEMKPLTAPGHQINSGPTLRRERAAPGQADEAQPAGFPSRVHAVIGVPAPVAAALLPTSGELVEAPATFAGFP